MLRIFRKCNVFCKAMARSQKPGRRFLLGLLIGGVVMGVFDFLYPLIFHYPIASTSKLVERAHSLFGLAIGWELVAYPGEKPTKWRIATSSGSTQLVCFVLVGVLGNLVLWPVGRWAIEDIFAPMFRGFGQ